MAMAWEMQERAHAPHPVHLEKVDLSVLRIRRSGRADKQAQTILGTQSDVP
jgi:hypothetical protein